VPRRPAPAGDLPAVAAHYIPRAAQHRRRQPGEPFGRRQDVGVEQHHRLIRRVHAAGGSDQVGGLLAAVGSGAGDDRLHRKGQGGGKLCHVCEGGVGLGFHRHHQPPGPQVLPRESGEQRRQMG
jgi:hypothetical protein